MNSNQFDRWIAVQNRQAVALEKIVSLLSRALPRQAPPNYQEVLEEFHHFNWGAIDARIGSEDEFGVSSVYWQGDRYLRRSPNNSYGATIFFSRCVGKDAEGRNQYERLITFKPFEDLKAEPISRKAELIVNKKN